MNNLPFGSYTWGGGGWAPSGSEQAMQYQQNRMGLQQSRYNLAMAPVQLGQATLGLERGKAEFEDWKAGAGLRNLQRDFTTQQTERQKQMLQYDPLKGTLRGNRQAYLSMNAPSWMTSNALRELELEDLALEQARAGAARAKFESGFYGGGGFSSWATPTFPSR